MSKQVKKAVPSKKQSSGFLSNFDLGNYIPEKFRTPAAILGIIILMLVFYSPVMFGDKTLDAGDLLQMKSTRAYIEKDRDGFSLWNPYLFGGMPAYATSTSLRWFDFSAVIYSLTARIYSAVFTNYEAIYTLSFLLMAITAFFFMRSRGAGYGISFLVAAAMIFSSGLTVLYFIGHMTKLMSLALFPFILMMMLKFQKEIKLLDVLILVFGMHLLILGAHIQIVYYITLFSVVYFIFYFAYSFIKKDKFLTKQLLKSLGVLSIAAVFAVLMSFDSYYSLYEYKPYSTRGAQSVTDAAAGGEKTATEQYAYNTSYSFSPGEVLTFFVPSYYGFGKSTYKGELTGGQDYPVNTYIGQMENVDAPMYMGIIVMILALFAFFIKWKEPFIKFCAVIIVFFLLISFGKNFPVIYDLIYKYLPAFDNFRVPSMILHVLQVIIPILAGLAVMRLIEIKNENKAKFITKIKISAAVVTVLAFISFILSSTFTSWMTERVTRYAQELSAGNADSGKQLMALAGYVGDMFAGDIHINLLLVALLLWVVYLFLTSKLSKTVFITAICVFALFDLFRIGNRAATYKNADEINSYYKQPAYVKIIKEQNDKDPFRIISFRSGNSLGDIIGSVRYPANYHTYFQLEDVSGYSSVKPRAYNDLMEKVELANPTLWKILGVKYIITSSPVELPGLSLVKSEEKNFVYKYEQAMPRAYFVDSVGVKSGIELINSINKNEFEPKKVAYVDKADFQVVKPAESAYVKTINYKDEKLELEANATGNNYLFFGTNYIPFGWKAKIDGKETNIYKTDHAFMGIVVPDGKHKVEFVYAPSSFTTGKYISLILNILLFAGIAVVLVFNRKKNEPAKAE